MAYRTEKRREYVLEWKRRDRENYKKYIQKDHGREYLSTRANHVLNGFYWTKHTLHNGVTNEELKIYFHAGSLRDLLSLCPQCGDCTLEEIVTFTEGLPNV